MRRFLSFIAVAAFAASTITAQTTVKESKTFDNFYIGINGGMTTKTTGYSWLDNMNPNAGIRIGRNFTPVFGLAVEGNAYFSNKPYESRGTAFRFINTSLLGTVNLCNWFGGYTGEPRDFEVIALFGGGWGHAFSNNEQPVYNSLTSKCAIDFAFNFGPDKQWQLYVEPAIIYSLNGDGYQGTEYNINRSMVQLNGGIIYKFRNSSGSHNFVAVQERSQAEIDGLNAQINALRGDIYDMGAVIAAKDRQIYDLQNSLEACNSKAYESGQKANLQPTVQFRQNMSVIDPAQYAPIERIAQYMEDNPEAQIEILGYASPEGPKEFNQELSEERAEVVKDTLIKKYHISPRRLSAKGMGATDKLFEQVEFNRVSTFNDNTK